MLHFLMVASQDDKIWRIRTYTMATELETLDIDNNH